ncbi:RNA polymerase I associated factor, A49-like protein [Mycena rosella]|uniref:RNA polymerase I associated factor, A49-like protein n=1 Tax=Mycena rosella TaxID=1033263 RepID=A0AAD7DXS4_MYCRO|nr:RNA polymerase I associated factor, A49-like protein [Mycena rosella]
MASSSLKKRKRDASPGPREIAFKIASHSVAPAEVGPMLVSFPSLEAPPSTAFRCYRKKTKTSTEADGEGELTVAGETDAVEFESNQEESQRVASAGCRYVIAVHNKRTSALTVLPTTLSPHVLTHRVKALKSIEPSPAPSAVEYFQARTALGETFGTKKAKAAIRARERNRVDVSAMEGVMDFVMAGIDKGAEGLMTTEKAKEVADSNRPIPPFSATATDPADVYPLHGIIPEPEWKALPVSAFFEAGGAHERKDALPFRHSQWVNARVESTMEQSDKGKKRNLKTLFYIASMMAFRRATERKFKAEDLPEKLSSVPGAVLDSLLARFTECPRGTTEPCTTPQLQLRLITHLLALCLRVDNYAADYALIARDLSLAPEQISTTFKSLGCKIVKLGERERTRLGLPDSVADEKRAVLTAPVEFPKQRMKKKTR